MTPIRASADQGRAAGIGVGLVGLQKKVCGIKAIVEVRKMCAVGAIAPGTLSTQRLKHRVHDNILQ